MEQRDLIDRKCWLLCGERSEARAEEGRPTTEISVSGDSGSSRCDRELDSGHFLKVQPMRLAYGCHIICERKDSNMDIKDF